MFFFQFSSSSKVEVLRRSLELWLAHPPPDPGVAVDFFARKPRKKNHVDPNFLHMFSDFEVVWRGLYVRK